MTYEERQLVAESCIPEIARGYGIEHLVPYMRIQTFDTSEFGAKAQLDVICDYVKCPGVNCKECIYNNYGKLVLWS